jgi:hypothetical protein
MIKKRQLLREAGDRGFPTVQQFYALAASSHMGSTPKLARQNRQVRRGIHDVHQSYPGYLSLLEKDFDRAGEKALR